MAIAALLAVIVAWLGFDHWTNRGDVQVRLIEVSGFAEDVRVWMPFHLNLELTNPGRRSTTVRRIDVEPDLDEFTEAYSLTTPYDLSPPLLLDPGAARTHAIGVTLLNAAQLPERTYALTFRVTLDTDDGTVTAELPARFEYHRDPKRRVLSRPHSTETRRAP